MQRAASYDPQQLFAALLFLRLRLSSTCRYLPFHAQLATSKTGFVTLPCGEREVSAPQELSGRCDCGPPRVHRRSAKRAVRLG